MGGQLRSFGRWLSVMTLAVGIFSAKAVSAQQCPDSPDCAATFGSLVLPSLTSDAANRVAHAEEASPDGLFTDNLIGLSYNRSWNSANGFTADDSTQPSTWMGFESYWSGSSELNIDLRAPNASSFLRPFGFVASYTGASTLLEIGGPPYVAGAAGVTLAGGTSQGASLVTILDQTNRSSHSNMLAMTRQNGTSSAAWKAGGTPRVNFALQSNLDANGFGNYGVLKFVGEWDFGEPVLDFESLGVGATLLRSLPGTTDTYARFAVRADGKETWGLGSQAVDTALYRSAPATLTTDGNLVVGGNLDVLGQKAALVNTTSFGKREVYAVESPGEWFEDFGSGTLSAGKATISIEPIFKETITTTDRYHVFLTPNSRCILYVSRKTSTAFTVRALNGSRKCGFDYRIVAKRKGYESVRLRQVGRAN